MGANRSLGCQLISYLEGIAPSLPLLPDAVARPGPGRPGNSAHTPTPAAGAT
jgi:hypothetical protein